jgi:6-phosphogluconolactonase
VSVNIKVLDDPADAVAELLVEAAGAGSDIVLTGGSSPKRAYELAAERRPDWTAATVWFTDERCVPPDHELSNFAMADAALLSRLESPPQVHRMKGELGHEAGAEDYAAVLGDDPHFDLVILGLGPDAHIASLFPNRPEKHIHDRFVVGVPESGLEPYVPRITLTLPAVNAGRHVVFLVTGADKAEAVRRAFRNEPDPELAVAQLRPGELTVFLDPAAAAEL